MIIHRLDKDTRKRRAHEVSQQWHRKFAWLPHRISSERVVWLGFYMRRYVFKSRYPKELRDRNPGLYSEGEWAWEYGLEPELVRERLLQ